MGVSNEVLERMTIEDRDAYIRMRQALDSLTYVALNEFELSDPEFDFSGTEFDLKDPKFDLSENEELRRNIFDTLSKANRQQIFEIVSDGVKDILKKINEKRGGIWTFVGPTRGAAFAKHSRELLGAEEFVKHSDVLLEDETQKEIDDAVVEASNRGDISCPPGFILVDGVCVPI
jgi:hypothetical protein